MAKTGRHAPKNDPNSGLNLNSQSYYYYSVNDKSKRTRRRTARIKGRIHRGSQAYLDTGFFKLYDEQERRDNLFFVLNNGMSKNNGRVTENIAKTVVDKGLAKAKAALYQAKAISEQTEKNFLKDFASGWREMKSQAIDDQLDSTLDRYGLKGLFTKDTYTSEDIEKFFNSPLFSITQGITADTDGQIFGSSIFDQYYTKIHDIAFGFRNAIKGQQNYLQAKKILETKFDEYLSGMGANVVTGKEGLGSMLGDFHLNDPQTIAIIKDQLIDSFLTDIMQMDPNSATNLNQSLIASQNNPSLVNLESESFQVHGPFDEYLATYVGAILQKEQMKLSGATATISQTGRETVSTSNRFKSMTNTLTKLNSRDAQGRTDIKMTYEFGKDFHSKYQLNITNKMVQGYSRSITAEGRKKSRASKRAHLYGGSQLSAALDRIESSSLFANGGLMSSTDYDDLVYMIINAAQGGIYQSQRKTIIEIVEAISSFLAMDEMSNELNMDGLLEGKINPKQFQAKPLIINLIRINGYYIPASYYFQALIDLLGKSQNKAWSSSITFANTFPEATATGRKYIQGYADWIQDNNLNYGYSFSNANKKVTLGRNAGDPKKVQKNIFENTKLTGFDLKWEHDINDFWKKFAR